jgi:tetratricopeptide (TPR) repeat protein
VQLYEKELGEPQAAETILLDALRREQASGRPGSVSDGLGAERELAYFWLRHDRQDEAIKVFRRRADEQPSAWRFFELGGVLEKAGKPVEALTWYRRACERNPPFMTAVEEAIDRVQTGLDG